MRRHKALPREGRARPRDHGHELRMAGGARLRGRLGRPGRVRLGGLDGRDEARLRQRHPVSGQAGEDLQAFRHVARSSRRLDRRPGGGARERLGAQALRRLRGGDCPARRQRAQDPPRPHRRQQHQPRHRTQAADPRPAGAQPQPSGSRRGTRISLHAQRHREGGGRGADAQGDARDAAERIHAARRAGDPERGWLLVGRRHPQPGHGGQGARPQRGRVHGRARGARSGCFAELGEVVAT